MQYNESELALFAETVRREAASEPFLGQVAVACVILNRVNDPQRWPDTISGVILQPLQFSTWNENDPQRTRHLDPKNTVQLASYGKAMSAVKTALALPLDLRRSFGNHYHTRAVSPSWSAGVEPVCIIAAHKFFNL